MSQHTIIQCTDLSKRFASKQALKGLNFEVSAGDPIALVGPNGAGKTTLLSILSSYITPSSGQVSLFGHKPGSKQLFGKIGALAQDARLDPDFSICKQLTLFAQLQGMSTTEARIEALRVLDLMSLSEACNELPGALSHGMAKRAAIAQALIGKPELILLDEPTAGLDPVNARNIRNLVSELSAETTFIISSHNLSELERLCKQVLHLDGGELQAQEDCSSSAQDDYLTLLTQNCPASELISATQKLEGLVNITQGQTGEFIINYDAQKNPALDQQLLSCLALNGWSYRQLIRGRTLEDKLFSQT